MKAVVVGATGAVGELVVWSVLSLAQDKTETPEACFAPQAVSLWSSYCRAMPGQWLLLWADGLWKSLQHCRYQAVVSLRILVLSCFMTFSLNEQGKLQQTVIDMDNLEVEGAPAFAGASTAFCTLGTQRGVRRAICNLKTSETICSRDCCNACSRRLQHPLHMLMHSLMASQTLPIS